MGTASSSPSSLAGVLPEGVSPEEGAGCVVPAEAKIHTRAGIMRAGVLAAMYEPSGTGKPIEIWTSGGWQWARVISVGETPSLKVSLSDGSWLECSAAASWPVLAPEVGAATLRGSGIQNVSSPDSSSRNADSGSHISVDPLDLKSVACSMESRSPVLGVRASGLRGAAQTSSVLRQERSLANIKVAIAEQREAPSDVGLLPSTEVHPSSQAVVEPEGTKVARALSCPPSIQNIPEIKSALGWGERPRGESQSPNSNLVSDVRETQTKRGWAPRIALNLRSGDQIVTRPIANFKELPETQISIPDAYSAGNSHGSQAAGGTLSGISQSYLAGVDGAPALSGDALRAFIDGWSDAQRGCLVGPENVMAELQILLRRIGIWRTLLEHNPSNYSLFIDSRNIWPAKLEARRLWARTLRTASQTIITVETLPKKAKMFRVILPPSCVPITVMVNSTMLAIPVATNTGAAPESTT